MEVQNTPQMADVFGVPTFYATDIVTEDAGAGNVRIWNCTRRGGLLVPNSEVIIPAVKLLLIGRHVSSYAQTIFNRDQLLLAGGMAH